MGEPWVGGPATFYRGVLVAQRGQWIGWRHAFHGGGGGWLAGCAVRAASLVGGLFGLWVWLRSDVPNFLSLLFFLFFFLCRQSPLSRFGTREATLTYRMFK